MQTVSDVQDEYIDCNECEQVGVDTCRLAFDSDGVSLSPQSAMEHEKRIRREIANSNERRRMQSINAGFQTLRDLLPQHEGEKLSKAAILQQTSEFIYSLEQEKTRLLAQNCQLKRLLAQQQQKGTDTESAVGSPLSAASIAVRRSASQESSAESVAPAVLVAPRTGSVGGEASGGDVEDEGECEEDEAVFAARAGGMEEEGGVSELRVALQQERGLRVSLERQLLQYRQHADTSNPPAKRRRLSPSPPPASPPHDLLLATAPVPAPESGFDDGGATGLYVSTTTSRQNLDTIVEAIRHLEGDHLFQDSLQEAPVVLDTCPIRGSDLISDELVSADTSVPVAVLVDRSLRHDMVDHHTLRQHTFQPHHPHQEHLLEPTVLPRVVAASEEDCTSVLLDDCESSLQEAPLALTTHRRYALSPQSASQHPYLHLMGTAGHGDHSPTS